MSDTAQNDPLSLYRETLAAARFAAEKHSAQRRKGNPAEPYVNHPIEVAHLLAEIPARLDPTLLIAGLLHDTVEDTNTTRAELAERFGEDVASLVMEVTDDKSLPKRVRKALQVERAPLKSARAQNLATADKISNMRSTLTSPPSDWTVQQRQDYFEWAKAVVDRFRAVDPALKAEFYRTYQRYPRDCGGHPTEPQS